jgi:actin related protein 2/3 complex, subunit 5
MADSELMADINKRKTKTLGLVQSKSYVEALKSALEAPPVSSKSMEVKDANAAVVESVLNSIGESDIASIVRGLSGDDVDVLMKYLYRVMQAPTSGAASTNYPVILKMHAQLVAEFGVGSIVRVISDRRTV